ncbi:serine protease [Pontiella sp.]|uniref:S1 family peptidase n=1 Tax=Pontiella sp. TaxID=2837462 RepID=UPI003562B38B
MKKPLMVILLSLAAWAMGDLEEKLGQLQAPTQEFVRIPAKYVTDRLERVVRQTGDPELGAFLVEMRMDASSAMRITINMEGMNVHQALTAVATATASTLVYENGRAIFMDPDSAMLLQPEKAAAVPQQKAPQIENVSFSDIDRSIVFVETGEAAGSAFVASVDGKIYIISNQHNFLGATKLALRAMHGGLLEFDSFEFCKTRDLVRFGLKAGQAKGLTVLQLAPDAPGIGDKIVVYGNSAGGNVATELKGEVLGVGPADIEVNAAIVPGNSGSPILDTKGRVLGVATYVTYALKFQGDKESKNIFKGTRFGKARRYGVRIPSDDWVAADLRAYLEQTYRLTDTKNYLEILNTLVMYWNGDDDYEESAKRIMSDYTSSNNRSKPPYTFQSPKTEAEATMLVKAFKRNYEEFVAKVNDMDVSSRDLEDMSQNFGRRSTTKAEMLDGYIRSSLLNRAKRIQTDLEESRWASRFLEEAAEPLSELVGELIRVLEENENPYSRIRELR